jgi:hypothetical protein
MPTEDGLSDSETLVALCEMIGHPIPPCHQQSDGDKPITTRGKPSPKQDTDGLRPVFKSPSRSLGHLTLRSGNSKILLFHI